MSEEPQDTQWMDGRNGGKLKRGGANEGAGRPKSIVREACATGMAQGTPRLIQIVLDERSSNSDVIKAWEALGRFGLGDLKELILEGSEQVRKINSATADFFLVKGRPEEFDEWADHIKAYFKDS